MQAALATPDHSCGTNDISNIRAFRVLADFHKSKYQFRGNVRLFDNTITAWVDHDDSGTYDPNGKKSIPVPKRDRQVFPSNCEDDKEARPKRPKITTWRHGRQIGESLTVTLKINSAAGKEVLAACQEPATDHPVCTAKESDEVDWEKQLPCQEHEFSEEKNLVQPNAHRLRRRQVRPSNNDRIVRIAGNTGQGDNPDSLAQLAPGDPAARGCRGCYEMGLACSLVDDPGTYPCLYCLVDEFDCELITPPKRKRACEACQRQRIRCSYCDGSDHSLACDGCRLSGETCYAGPEEKYEIIFSSSRKSGHFIPTPARPYLACTPCRSAKKWCSLADKTKEPPCKRCTIEGSACTFDKLLKGKKAKKVRMEEGVTETTPPEALMTTVEATCSGEGGSTMTIKTRFAHPIVLNHQPPEDGSDPCDWCSNPAFGVMGHGELEVEVIKWANGNGYTEVFGGHVGNGHQPSKMCVHCTFDRLRIASCKDHEIRRIDGLDPEKFDFDAAYAGLLSGPSTQPTTSRTAWCAMCPSPAFLECCAAQVVVVEDQEQEEQASVGCGLMLCEACAVNLDEECEGNLSNLLSIIEHSSQDYPMGARGDSSFLTPDGEVVQRIHCVGGGK